MAKTQFYFLGPNCFFLTERIWPSTHSISNPEIWLSGGGGCKALLPSTSRIFWPPNRCHPGCAPPKRFHQDKGNPPSSRSSRWCWMHWTEPGTWNHKVLNIISFWILKPKNTHKCNGAIIESLNQVPFRTATSTFSWKTQITIKSPIHVPMWRADCPSATVSYTCEFYSDYTERIVLYPGP